VDVPLLYEIDVELAAAPAERAISRTGRYAAALKSEGLLIGLVGILAGISLSRLAVEVTQDTWLSLLAGREISHGGVHHASLTWWALDRQWIDQQWLAHLAFYGVYVVGGLVLLCVLGVLTSTGALAAAIGYARRRGATPRTIGWLVAVSALSVIAGASNIRTQILVLPLFVGVLGLLVADAHRPTRRVLLVLPIILLWANLHGSVVVPVALVLLRGAVGSFHPGARVRHGALAAAALLASVVTPYGTDIFGYYHRTLLNPGFHSFVAEWRPLSLGLSTAPVYLLACVSFWLVARHVRRLGTFAVLAQLLFVLLAFVAVRNAVWLGLGSIMLLAPALDSELRHKDLENRRVNLLIGVGGSAFAVVLCLAVILGGTTALTSGFASAAGDTVAKAITPDPSGRVLADERFADWLMFEHPSLVGRVAYDASFEQLTSQQLARVIRWKDLLGDWNAAARGARAIVLKLPNDGRLVAAYQSDRSVRMAYRDKQVAVFLRR
jgi:alkylhydroperoxidase family enzyme